MNDQDVDDIIKNSFLLIKIEKYSGILSKSSENNNKKNAN